ncbi:complex I NDUFA9 subunit family protein [Sandarakinorhabdus sp.]|uniref:complex I NDUFA9 subunit family protein n=1 Tax=Sandarakinorhabdus sp. TaxID=1916663 RepID=UPI00286E5C15|nr:complex I NDUFA9 subunit family protein [Sandarakinorhabdus sp.]
MIDARNSVLPPLGPGSIVTVIGGSGFLGRYIVQELAAAGCRLRVVSRNPDSALFLKPLGDLGQIQLLRGDVTSGAGLAAAFEGAAAGVNLVGILAESGHQTFAATQSQGAARAAQLAAAAGITRYVQMSAIGADAGSAIPYARSKGEGEAAVLAAIPSATILRPSLVAGPEDQFFNRFAGMARSAPVLPVIAGDSRFQPVYVRDVAAAVVAALGRSDAQGRTYWLGGPDVLSFRDILKLVVKLSGRETPLFELSDFSAGLLARLGDILPFMPMTSDQLAMLRNDNIVIPGVPTLADLGVAATPLSAFLPQMLERFQPGGRFGKKRG